MKLAILIGASAETKESPLVPLSLGSHRFIQVGVIDSRYDIHHDDGTITMLERDTSVKGQCDIKLMQKVKGTERVGSISIFAELIPESEDNDGTITT